MDFSERIASSHTERDEDEIDQPEPTGSDERSEDPQVMASCDEVEPILEAKRTESFDVEESTAWIA